MAGVDLGTTSVSALLVDAETGLELARSSVPNRQQSFGADILSRLSAAADGARGELKSLAEKSVVETLNAAAIGAGVSTRDITRLVVASNSAMSALLTGADTSALATFPFTASPTGGPLTGDSTIFAELAVDAETLVIAPIAGFVGGDALAATLAAGMIDADAPVLLVDFGTNAEIVLASHGRLTVASAAAGPAFEGIGVSCGGPVAEGAITKLRIARDGTIITEVLGDGAGEWLSGSGLVSAIAGLRRAGAIDETGRLSESGVLAGRVSTNSAGVTEVRLGEGPDDGPVLSQLDIRAFQLAKAAVRVGVDAVLACAGIDAEDVERVCVAGAFGFALLSDDLETLGVMPGVLAARAAQSGNAALDGAAMVALDPSLAAILADAAVDATHVELARDPAFARALIEATSLAQPVE